MKTITMDFDTYQKELKDVAEKAQQETTKSYSKTLINHLEVINMEVPKLAIKAGVSMEHANALIIASQNYLSRNFTNDELKILLRR